MPTEVALASGSHGHNFKDMAGSESQCGVSVFQCLGIHAGMRIKTTSRPKVHKFLLLWAQGVALRSSFVGLPPGLATTQSPTWTPTVCRIMAF